MWVASSRRTARAHERPIGGLEVVPRGTARTAAPSSRDGPRRGTRPPPQVALVDELAHTNVPGGRHEKRWQDIQELLDAGIEVISTVNVQHLESLNDVVQRITGVPQQETVPDEVVRPADQIELVDMSPESLRRRLAHGNVYAAEKVDAALGNYFRVGNLTALRELALLWVADRVDECLQRYRSEHGIDRTWEARERIVVALPGGPEGETLIRRAARIAARAPAASCWPSTSPQSDGLTGACPKELAAQRHLVESLGGTFHSIIGDDVAEGADRVRAGMNATQLVLGFSRAAWQSAASLPARASARPRSASGRHRRAHGHPRAVDGPRPPPDPPARSPQRRRLAGDIAAVACSPLLTVRCRACAAA